MGHLEHKQQAPKQIIFSVITISDTRTESTDETGKLLLEQLRENGHKVSSYHLLKNSPVAINEVLIRLTAENDIQVIITIGGTGISNRDITIETVTPLLSKKLDGFGELFRYLTFKEIGSTSIMSRALGGTIKDKIILCLPGSKNAMRLAINSIILPEISHLVREVKR